MYQLQDEIDRLSGNCRSEADPLPDHQREVNLVRHKNNIEIEHAT